MDRGVEGAGREGGTATGAQPLTRPRVLLVGPCPIEGDVIGGAKLTFAELVRSLQESGSLDVQVLNTSRPLASCGRVRRTAYNAWTMTRVLGTLARRAGRFHGVLFNAAPRGAMKAAPAVWLTCRLHRRPLGLRLFGGDLDTSYDEAGPAVRWLARRTFLKAPLLILETRHLERRFAGLGSTRWLPGTRECETAPTERRGRCRRFVFIAQLRREKGIAEALEASRGLPQDARLDLYGPAMPGYEIPDLSGERRAHYGGALKPEDVTKVLAASDALVFPSYHPGEGLPGVVVEAMQCGLPVIACRWRALPEIVRDGENGLLVDARSADDLAAAMRRLYEDDRLYGTLTAGALRSGDQYRTSRWTPRIESWLLEMCEVNRPVAPERAS